MLSFSWSHTHTLKYSLLETAQYTHSLWFDLLRLRALLKGGTSCGNGGEVKPWFHFPHPDLSCQSGDLNQPDPLVTGLHL